MKGIIFDIQRFCTKDGPGIRTTVFFKGCPLRCLWCHNPESQNLCVEKIKKASGDGIQICGKEYTVDEVLEIVQKDSLYYEKSGGGLTLSGGEPLFQPDFALELMRQAKARGFNIALETCGMASEEVLRKSAEFVDLYLYDFKESDPYRHKEYTGFKNDIILENIRILNELKKDIILRCPIIPTFNDRDEHFNSIASLIEKYSAVIKVQIEPYHSFGVDKYRRLGRNYQLNTVKTPDCDIVDNWYKNIKKFTNKPVEKL